VTWLSCRKKRINTQSDAPSFPSSTFLSTESFPPMDSIFSLLLALGSGTQSTLFILWGVVLLGITPQLMLVVAMLLVPKPPLESDFAWLTELP